jgi:chromosome segregation ATPase
MFSKDITPEQIEALKEEHEAVLLSLNNSKALLAQKEAEAKQRESEVDDLVLKIDESNADLLSVKTANESEKSALAEIISELRIELSQKQKELSELVEKITTEKQAYRDFLLVLESEKQKQESEATAEIQEQKKVIASLSLLKSSLDEDIVTNKASLDTLIKKISDKEIYLSGIEEQSITIEQRIREDAEKSMERVAEAETKVENLIEQVNDLNTQSVSLIDEISDLQKAKKIAQQELDKILEQNKIESVNAEQLKKRHLHIIQKEEYLRDKYELIGETYPEFKI